MVLFQISTTPCQVVESVLKILMIIQIFIDSIKYHIKDSEEKEVFSISKKKLNVQSVDFSVICGSITHFFFCSNGKKLMNVMAVKV